MPQCLHGARLSPYPLGNHGNPSPGIHTFTPLDPVSIFFRPQAFTSQNPVQFLPRAPWPLPQMLTTLPPPPLGSQTPSNQPRMAHSLHPLGYGHLVASGTGECGDRRPGPPDPLPGFAPGCPGPVVFWICPGTLCFDIFCTLNFTNSFFLSWEHDSAPLKLPLLRGRNSLATSF